MKRTVVQVSSFLSVVDEVNSLVEDAQKVVIDEAAKHFNTIKKSVRDRDDDARFFYSDGELNLFLKKITKPKHIWVSTLHNDDGSFYCYRVGRVVYSKDGLAKRM